MAVETYEEYMRLLQTEMSKNGIHILSDDEIEKFIVWNKLDYFWGIRKSDVKKDMKKILEKNGVKWSESAPKVETGKSNSAGKPNLPDPPKVIENKASDNTALKNDKPMESHSRTSASTSKTRISTSWRNMMDKRILETIKIVALGASGTGKTSYLAGIFHQFYWNQYRVCDRETNPDDELIITIDSDFEAEMFPEGMGEKSKTDNFIKNLEYYKVLLSSVPSKINNDYRGTQSQTTYIANLNLSDNEGEVILPIEVWDYRGAISEIMKENADIEHDKADIKELVKALRESNIILILIDSSIAKQYDGTPSKTRLIEDKLCTRFFSELIHSMFVSKKNEPKYIQFVYTKWDTVNEEERKVVHKCTKDIYGRIIRDCEKQEKKYSWRYDTKPVTLVGYTTKANERKLEKEGLVSYEYTFAEGMNPQGLAESFLAAIKTALSMRCDEKNRRRIEKEQLIRRCFELKKCYQLEKKEKRKIVDEIVGLQKIKDENVRECVNCEYAVNMFVNHKC